jgi:hypothetical protein
MSAHVIRHEEAAVKQAPEDLTTQLAYRAAGYRREIR